MKRLVQESTKVKDNFYEIEANLEVIDGAGIRSKVASQRQPPFRKGQPVTKAFWAADRDVSVRSVTGRLYSRANVVYCKELSECSYSVGLELLESTGNWPALN